MKSTRALTAVLALSVVFALSFAAEAGPFGPNFQRRGMGPRLAGLRTLLELKLSESQQAEMMKIINRYQTERETLRKSAFGARRNLSAVLHSEQFNEQDVRKAFREASAIREQLVVLSVRMIAELKSVLTPGQQELLKQHRSLRREMIKSRLSNLLENLSD